MRPLGALVAGVIVLPSFLSVVGASAQEPTSTPGKEPTPAAAKPDDSVPRKSWRRRRRTRSPI
jgi:hypothetical protein